MMNILQNGTDYLEDVSILKISAKSELNRLGQLKNYLDHLKLIPREETFMNAQGTTYGIPYCWVAGGAIRDFLSGTKCSDFDIFFKSKENLEEYQDYILEDEGEILFEKDNAIKIKLREGIVIDLVKKYFKSPEDCISKFDFTVSAFAFDGQFLYCSVNSLIDLAGKKLALNRENLLFPVSTMKRLAKYVAKGFKPCVGTMMALGKNIAAIEDMKQFEEMKKFYFD